MERRSLREKIRWLLRTKSGRPFREVLRERALEMSIPGRSNLHGSNIWLIPNLVAWAMFGDMGFLLAGVVSVALWFLVLPLFDEMCLRTAVEEEASSDLPLKKVLDRMGKQLAVAYGILILPPVCIIAYLRDVDWFSIGAAILLVFAGEIVVYMVGEALWAKNVKIGTRLRIYDRNHHLIDDAVEEKLTVREFDQRVRLQLGERYQRTYGWQRKKLKSAS